MAFPTSNESISLGQIRDAYGDMGSGIIRVSNLNNKVYYDSNGTQYTIKASDQRPFNLGKLRGMYAKFITATKNFDTVENSSKIAAGPLNVSSSLQITNVYVKTINNKILYISCDVRGWQRDQGNQGDPSFEIVAGSTYTYNIPNGSTLKSISKSFTSNDNITGAFIKGRIDVTTSDLPGTSPHAVSEKTIIIILIGGTILIM